MQCIVELAKKSRRHVGGILLVLFADRIHVGWLRSINGEGLKLQDWTLMDESAEADIDGH